MSSTLNAKRPIKGISLWNFRIRNLRSYKSSKTKNYYSQIIRCKSVASTQQKYHKLENNGLWKIISKYPAKLNVSNIWKLKKCTLLAPFLSKETEYILYPYDKVAEKKLCMKEAEYYNTERRRRQFPRWQVSVEAKEEAALTRAGPRLQKRRFQEKENELIDFLMCLTTLRLEG